MCAAAGSPRVRDSMWVVPVLRVFLRLVDRPAQATADRLCNQLSVEAAVFNEDFVRVSARNDHTGEIDAFALALKRLGVGDRLGRCGIEMNPMVRHKLKVGTIAGHRKDKVILKRPLTFGRFDDHFVRPNLFEAAVEIGFHFTGLDPVLDVGLDPVFDVVMNAGTTMDHGYACPSPKELKSSNGSGILSANDQNIVIVIGVSLAIVMNYFFELLTRDVELVRDVVIARRENNLFR